MAELAAGLILTVVALALVLEPLFRPAAPVPRLAGEPDEVDLADVEESESPKVQALLALREIEFDRATGKLSDEDYLTLKARYADRALAAMREEEVGAAEAVEVAEGADEGDPAEALVQRLKRRGAAACPTCGPRPEPGAVFCSTCGRSLVGSGRGPRCWVCGAAVPAQAKFCHACGKAVAA